MPPSLAPQPRPVDFASMMAPPPSLLSALKLHHLRTQEQIASVLHLRDEIDLSVHAAAGQDFVRLEKKETRWASCSASNSMVI
jgi:hypothetical protein